MNMLNLLRRYANNIGLCFFVLAMSVISLSAAKAEPLKIGYSDWPGWVAWEVGIRKGWFKEQGVDVKFQWMDYVESLDAFIAGELDGVSATNGDAIAIGATGAKNVMILVNDYSNGNDIIVGGPGVNSIEELKGKKVGVEVGFVGHLLLLNSLFKNQMSEDSVKVTNVATDASPESLASGAVDAIVAWQPHSGRALKNVRGAKPLYTSADEPGLIYDVLTVTPESLDARRSDWMKVVEVWYRIVDYIKNPETQADAVKIMARRVNLRPEQYQSLLAGTQILDAQEVKASFPEVNGYRTLYGSSKISDSFFVANDVYGDIQNIDDYIDLSLMKSVIQ